MKRAYADALEKQRYYADQGESLMFEGRSSALAPWQPGAVQGSLADAAKARMSAYQGLSQVPMSFGPNLGTAQSEGQALGAAQAQGQQRANLAAYGDWLFGNAMKNLTSQRALNQLTSFAGGTASLLPYQMYEAQHSQDALAQVGALISSLGTSTQPTTQAPQAPANLVQQPGMQSYMAPGYGGGFYGGGQFNSVSPEQVDVMSNATAII